MNGIWEQVLTYLYIKKRDKSEPRNINIAMMHGMNRISLIMFLVGVIVMLVRLLKH